MITPQINLILDRQLLLQLGDRIKRLRKAQRLGTVEMAARASISRNTLRAVESGDPGAAIGTYVRVMSILGVSGELALLAGDILSPPPAAYAATQSRIAAPSVEIRISADQGAHRIQDLQSLALHGEAVRLVKLNPALVQQAKDTLLHWLKSGDTRSVGLWREWEKILDSGAWRKVLSRTRRAQQLRQASPLVTVLPDEVRQRVLAQANRLKHGLVLGTT
jgi:transcriptional regulator with XRE-family HTH domain